MQIDCRRGVDFAGAVTSLWHVASYATTHIYTF